MLYMLHFLAVRFPPPYSRSISHSSGIERPIDRATHLLFHVSIVHVLASMRPVELNYFHMKSGPDRQQVNNNMPLASHNMMVLYTHFEYVPLSVSSSSSSIRRHKRVSYVSSSSSSSYSFVRLTAIDKSS